MHAAMQKRKRDKTDRVLFVLKSHEYEIRYELNLQFFGLISDNLRIIY